MEKNVAGSGGGRRPTFVKKNQEAVLYQQFFHNSVSNAT